LIKQAFSEVLEEQKTEQVSMSEAKTEFAKALLAELGYTISNKVDNTEGTVQVHEFDWGDGEDARTAAAGVRLTSLMHPVSAPLEFEFVRVTGFKLRDVKSRKRTATGKTVLRVARKGWTPQTTNVFSQASGLVELKIEQNRFSEAQLHLELVSFSTVSVFKQGVVLLATDCLKRWGVWSFKSKDTVSGEWYRDSSLAIADFKKKMETIVQRSEALQLATIPEHDDNADNDLDKQGGDSSLKGGQGGAPKDPPAGPGSQSDSSRTKHNGGMHGNIAAALYEQDLLGFEEISKPELEAFNRVQFLTAFASALQYETGEECSVPIWARVTHPECREANEETGGSRTPTSTV
jgi:hypothetical protein